MSTVFIGLKLGSNNTWIYKAGNGLVLNESTLVAVSANPKNHEVKAIGDDAKMFKGRSGNDLMIFSPIANGKIVYEDLAAQMLKGFLKKIFPVKTFGQKIKAILCIPLGISASEKKKYEIACFKAGIADVYIIPDIIAYAIGSEINLQNEKAHMIVNIGGDTTNIAIISGYSIISGSLINIAIAKYIEETYNLKISNEIAEQVKIDICSLFDSYTASCRIVGINKRTKLKEEKTINSSEFFPIIDFYYNKIAESVLSIIASSSPETIADISKEGIYYFGGATSIIGFEKYIFDKTGFKINTAFMSKSNIVGIGELIKFPQILKKILKNC